MCNPVYWAKEEISNSDGNGEKITDIKETECFEDEESLIEDPLILENEPTSREWPSLEDSFVVEHEPASGAGLPLYVEGEELINQLLEDGVQQAITWAVETKNYAWLEQMAHLGEGQVEPGKKEASQI